MFPSHIHTGVLAYLYPEVILGNFKNPNLLCRSSASYTPAPLHSAPGDGVSALACVSRHTFEEVELAIHWGEGSSLDGGGQLWPALLQWGRCAHISLGRHHPKQAPTEH